MTTFDATEAAYKNGYAAGIKEKLDLQKRCEELQRERDALFEVVERGHHCADCRHFKLAWSEEPCSECRNNTGRTLHWEWRGVNETE